jgi:hypothetical protein
MSDFPQIAIPSTQVEIGGFTWTIYADIKVSKALQRHGYAPPRRPTFGGGKPQQKPLTAPLYRDDGAPCCPFHTNRNGQPTPIRFVASKDGRPGFWGCPSAAQQVAGETINSRGYCDLRFDLPAPAEQPDKVTR